MIIDKPISKTVLPRRKRRLRFGMRTLLSLTTICAFGLYWLAIPLYEAYRERSAVEGIQGLGGHIGFSTDAGARRNFVVRQIVGDSQPAVSLSFDNRVSGFAIADDACLVHVGSLHTLRSVSLEYTAIDGSGLRYLATLTKLQSLSLSGTMITDQTIDQLPHLESLVELNLDRTRIHETGLQSLAKHSTLTTLSLNGTGVTDEAIGNLPNLETLKELYLNETALTDAGIYRLPELPNLRVLEVGRGPWLPETVALIRRRWPEIFAKVDANNLNSLSSVTAAP